MAMRIHINEKQEAVLIEAIKVHKGEKGREHSCQGAWEEKIPCDHCDGTAYFAMSISEGTKGRGRINVFDENGVEQKTETQSIGLYYCPNCYKFTARNNMA